MYHIWGCKREEHLAHPVTKVATQLDADFVIANLKVDNPDTEYWYEYV